MPAPTATLTFILATLFGAAFHLVMGGDMRRLALFLLSGWVGVVLGHLAGVALDITLFKIGTLRMAPAAVGALIVLLFAHLLTTQRARRPISR